MLNRLTIAAIFAVLLGVIAATAHAAPNRPATPPPTDFWQDTHDLGDKYFLNMAHQGGEVEAPGNTLYAFKTAVADRGADTLEMDGYMTLDGVFVITHDLSTNPTSNSSVVDSGAQINTRTLAQLKQLDFAYKFRPGTGHYGFPHGNAPAEEYIYRGIATGEKQPPEGYAASDFKIATFREVLDALPNTPMNVDMKAPGNNPQMAIEAAEAVANIMADYPERSEDVIVASFYQPAIEAFHEENPDHKALSAGESALLSYIQGNPVVPTPVAAQPPDRYNLSGTLVDTVPILKQHTDHDGFALHVWPANGSVDGPELWQKVKDQGAHGFFTDKPAELHEYLCETGIPRPDGRLRCPQQQCPEGLTGYAPNCEEIPVCPDGTVGTPPDCQKVCPTGSVLEGDECKCPPPNSGNWPNCVISDPMTILTKVIVSPKKGKIKAGKSFKLKVTIRAKPGLAPRQFRINLKSSNKQVKVPKSVIVNLNGKEGSRVVQVRATKKAKGKATVTAKNGKLSAKSVLTVKKAAKKKARR